MNLIEKTLARLFRGQINIGAPSNADLFSFDSTANEWISIAQSSLAINFDQLAGAWSTWAPTVGGANGTVLSSSTVNDGIYISLGRLTLYMCEFDATVSTSGGSITLTAPINDSVVNQQLIGVAYRYTSGSTTYRLMTSIISGTTFFLGYYDGSSIPTGAQSFSMLGFFEKAPS